MLRRSLGVLILAAGTLSGCSTILASVRGDPSPDLASRLDAIFADTTFSHAHWGVLIRSLETGETVYALNDERLFVPASNVKLFSGSAILETLGPDYQYATIIASSGRISAGVLDGSLVVTGTGDPTFSSRFLADPRDTFRAWADSLRAHGITRVTGGIVAVDTAFAGPVYGQGWMWDDLLGSSSAPYGALQFNENILELDLFPSQTTFQPALVVLTPPTQAVRVINDTRTVPPGSITNIRVSRDDLGKGVVVRGEIEAETDGVSRTVSVTDPTLYLVSVLRETLREQGILIEGQAVHHSELESYDPAVAISVPLFTHRSVPLRNILPAMLKPSQNQLAETMLVTVGREIRGESTAGGGAAVVDSLLADWGLSPMRHRLADGSGLSRYDLASPALFVGLLERMDRSVHRDIWLASLPLGGRDGTLENRMRQPPLLDNVVAKTGTLSGVRTLSGYLTAQSGERFVFSILANNHMVGSAAVDRAAENALAVVASTR